MMIRTLRNTASILVIIALIGLTGLAESAAAPDQGLSETQKQVRKALVTLPFYSVFDNFRFEVQDEGKVVLSGQTIRPSLKKSAQKVVERLEGIEEVENRIEVLPVSFQDDRLRVALYRALYGHPQFNRFAGRSSLAPIHIIVKNGHASLEGVVLNKQQKILANHLARRVGGVFSVTNNLLTES